MLEHLKETSYFSNKVTIEVERQSAGKTGCFVIVIYKNLNLLTII